MTGSVPEAEEIVFEKQVAVAVSAIRKEFLHDATLDRSELVRFTVDELVLRLEKLIWANPLGRMVISYPATPWEHFRATYFHRNRLGRWLVKRRPLRFHYEVKSALAAFPESHQVWPDTLGRRVFILRDAAVLPQEEN